MGVEVRAEIRETRAKDVRSALVAAHGSMPKESSVCAQAAVMRSSTDCGRLGDSRGVTGRHLNLDHGMPGGAERKWLEKLLGLRPHVYAQTLVTTIWNCHRRGLRFANSSPWTITTTRTICLSIQRSRPTTRRGLVGIVPRDWSFPFQRRFDDASTACRSTSTSSMAIGVCSSSRSSICVA